MSRARRIPGVMVAGLCAVTLQYSQPNEPKAECCRPSTDFQKTHQSRGIVLAVGRVEAWDGKYASSKIAKEIMKRVAGARNPPKKR